MKTFTSSWMIHIRIGSERTASVVSLRDSRLPKYSESYLLRVEVGKRRRRRRTLYRDGRQSGDDPSVTYIVGNSRKSYGSKAQAPLLYKTYFRWQTLR